VNEREEAAERGRRALADIEAARREEAGRRDLDAVVREARRIGGVFGADVVEADPWAREVTVRIRLERRSDEARRPGETA
jgi:hypothetical protein